MLILVHFPFHLLIWSHSYSTFSAKNFFQLFLHHIFLTYEVEEEKEEHHTADMGNWLSSFCSVISIGLWASNVTVVLNSDRNRILLRAMEKMVENTQPLGKLRRRLKNKEGNKQTTKRRERCQLHIPEHHSWEYTEEWKRLCHKMIHKCKNINAAWTWGVYILFTLILCYICTFNWVWSS